MTKKSRDLSTLTSNLVKMVINSNVINESYTVTPTSLL